MRTTRHVPRRRWVGTAAVVVCLSVAGTAQQAQQIRGVAGSGQAPAYLALGDSYPYGSEGSGFLPNNDNFWTGYPDFLRAILDRPLVNGACPGETAASFLTGDPALAGPNCEPAKTAGLLHVDYAGSQMAFAESYLASHDRTVLVTLQLGGNDFQAFAAACQGSGSCILAGFPAFVATLAANFGAILNGIRGTGYGGQIVVVEYPSTNFNSTTAYLQSQIYLALQPVVASYGGEMAPVFARFRDATLPFAGDSCAAGLLITNADGTCNIHPTDAGHQLIASIIAEMLPISPAPAQ